MSPAFSSPKQAAAFGLLLATMLLLPVAAAKTGLFPRQEAYATMPAFPGPFSFMQRAIFEEKSDADIVFMGASCVFFGVDTPQVQQALSRKLGRDAHVMTLAGLWAAEDRNYLILRDLLQHRKVKMVVYNMEEECAHYYEEPHAYAYRFFELENDPRTLAGVAPEKQIAFYGEAVLGTPRHLLSLLIPPIPDPSPETEDLGMRRRPFGYKSDRSTFIPFMPTPPQIPADDLIFSDRTRSSFHIGGLALDRFQAGFLRKIGDLLREKNIPLVILDTPPKWRNPGWNAQHHEDPRDLPPGFVEPTEPATVVEEYTHWDEVFGMPVDLVGVPPSRLFAGLTDAQVKLLYADRIHFNDNGRVYFTHVITPALLELYEKKTGR